MKLTSKKTKSYKSNPIFFCEKCNIHSLTNKQCPCPNSDCNAEIVGSITTEIERIILIDASKN